jgi:hypothetical protein
MQIRALHQRSQLYDGLAKIRDAKAQEAGTMSSEYDQDPILALSLQYMKSIQHRQILSLSLWCLCAGTLMLPLISPRWLDVKLNSTHSQAPCSDSDHHSCKNSLHYNCGIMLAVQAVL